jgi:hypothetical protein
LHFVASSSRAIKSKFLVYLEGTFYICDYVWEEVPTHVSLGKNILPWQIMIFFALCCEILPLGQFTFGFLQVFRTLHILALVFYKFQYYSFGKKEVGFSFLSSFMWFLNKGEVLQIGPFHTMCVFSHPTLWEPSDSVLPLVASFFGGSVTRVGVCFPSSRHFFGYHASTFSLMCGSRGKCLVINSSYHTNTSFIISPLFYNTTYLFWLATSYNCTPFMVSMWSYHWQSRYPFALVPLWEWR